MQSRTGVLMALCLTVISASAGAAPATVTSSYSGAVEIRRDAADATALIIAVDSIQSGPRDGFADVAYVFYSESASPDFAFRAERAHVEDFGGSQLVVMANGRHLVFSIGGETPLERGRNATVFANGAGLARHWGDEVAKLRVADDGSAGRVGCDGPDTGPCYSDWSLGYGGGSGGCDVGGCPATSCSVGGGNSGTCSVTCPAGYCACCNYGGLVTNSGCRCIRG